jgi:hypothetical protein
MYLLQAGSVFLLHVLHACQSSQCQTGGSAPSWRHHQCMPSAPSVSYMHQQAAFSCLHDEQNHLAGLTVPDSLCGPGQHGPGFIKGSRTAAINCTVGAPVMTTCTTITHICSDNQQLIGDLKLSQVLLVVGHTSLMALPAHRSSRCDRQCSSISRSPRLSVVRWHTCAPRSRPCAVLQNNREPKLAEPIDEARVRILTSSWLQTADYMPPQVPPPSEDKDTVLHFAYGANMSWSTLARRDVRVLRYALPYIVGVLHRSRDR